MNSSILTITRIFTKYAQRNPWFYFLGVVLFPASLLIPMSILAESSAHADIVIGSAICATTITTISDISDIISYDRYTNAISFFVTRPIKPYQYILGVGLSTLFYNLVGMVVIFLLGFVMFDLEVSVVRMVGVFALITAGWFISCTVGFAIGMWGPPDHRANTNLASIIAYCLTFLAPAYYPVSALPESLQGASHILYTTNLSVIGKAILRHEPMPMVSGVILGFYLLLSAFLLLKVARWKTT